MFWTAAVDIGYVGQNERRSLEAHGHFVFLADSRLLRVKGFAVF